MRQRRGFILTTRYEQETRHYFTAAGYLIVRPDRSSYEKQKHT